jgi:radical SAM superfamily enzyme YgiQ (UPF0313 family)
MNGILFNINRPNCLGRGPGAHRIATELRKNNWNIEVVDFFTYWSFDELKQLLISRIDNRTKFVAFGSIFAVWPDLAEDIASWIKENHPHIIIIYGTQLYIPLKTKHIDYQFTGFAETSVINLLKYLFSNGDPVECKTIKGTKIITSTGSAPWKNPIIIYEDRDFLKPYEWVGVEFSRGCKFSCDFCNFPILGVKGDWTRDSDNFELQLNDAYDRFGVSRYFISDETFNDSTEKVTKFANIVDKLNFDPFFTGFLRADLTISRGQSEMEELAKMKMFGHFYGIESFNHRSTKAISKGMHPDKVKQGLIDIKNYFKSRNNGYYRGTISLIAGLPYETEESIYDTYAWLKSNWQGENFVLNALEIPKLTIEESVNKMSKMSLDYSKYGYTILKEEDNLNNNKWSNNTVIWQNEHTDYYKIQQITDNIVTDSYNYDFRLMNFHPTLFVSDKSIEDFLKIKEGEFEPFDENTNFAKNYINKKLSV